MSKGVLGLIGNTPIIKLRGVTPERGAEVWLKYEAGNPTGSYKDRVAMSVLSSAIRRHDVSPGDTIVEYTGGSTGSSLAFVSAALGLKFIAVFSDAFSHSKQQTMEVFGAEVIVEESYGKGITPELITRMKDRAMSLCDDKNAYYVDQFGSPDVTVGYEPMGQEIADALDRHVDVLCASVGTGGALMGTWQGLVKSGSKVSVVAFEPAQSPFLTTGKGGAHKVEGVGVGFEPPFLDRTGLSEIRTVDQDIGFAMCRRLAKEEEAGQRVVTWACDSGVKYLGGKIYT